MDEAMMNTVADHFADAAELLKIAGFDMCLLHGGHGWLLDQFISPLFNTRTDEYGGPLENRAKFPLMVIDRVRERVGDDFLIEYNSPLFDANANEFIIMFALYATIGV